MDVANIYWFHGVFFPDVASNACPWVLTSLDQMNVKFSCQSKAEIQHLLEQEIDPSKVFFAGHSKVSTLLV